MRGPKTEAVRDVRDMPDVRKSSAACVFRARNIPALRVVVGHLSADSDVGAFHFHGRQRRARPERSAHNYHDHVQGIVRGIAWLPVLVVALPLYLVGAAVCIATETARGVWFALRRG